MTKIFIDAGHGGSDPGAVGNGLKEKDLTLQIAKRIESILKNEYSGFSLKLSRTDDKTLSLDQRTDMANAWGADFFLSIHINAGGGIGYEDYIYNGNVSSATIAYQNTMHAEITRMVDFRNRGKKRKNLHVLRETKMPAFLSENGFIDNVSDARKLKDLSYIEKIARGHVNGLAKAFGLKKKTQPKPSSQIKKDVFYRVVTGSFADRDNAEKRVNELKKAGFDSFIDVYKE